MISLYICSDYQHFLFELNLLENKIIKNCVDYSEKNFFNFIDDFSQINFFKNDDINIIKNPIFLVDVINRNDTEKIKKIESILSLNKIYFLFNDDKNKIKNNLIKVIKLGIDNIWDKKGIIKKILDRLDLVLNKEGFDFLSNYLPSDFGWIYNEIKKIKIFSNNNQINIDEIKKTIFYNINQDVFFIIDWYFNNNKEKLFEYFKYFNNKDDYFEIFRVLISQLFNIKLIILEYQKDPNFFNISKKIGMPLFYFNKLSKIIVSNTKNNIENLLKNLLKLEIEVYKNNLDFVTNFKLFLIKDNI